ncbi:MAG TPA: transglycosylase SLT domain-containing protein [Pseudoxanthomonas sp.]
MSARPLRDRLGDIARAIVAAAGFALVMSLICAPARAQVYVAPASAVYRLSIERESARVFGLAGSEYVARLAAQLHQESGFRPDAESPYAQGLAQFTPATAKWLPTICPAVGTPDPWDPQWSLRAQACYMGWLLGRVKPFQHARPMSACTQWAFALRGYNGGEGWLQRERLAAQQAGADANDWSEVARYRVRAKWAHKENKEYALRILLVLEPRYLSAGWPGKAVC